MSPDPSRRRGAPPSRIVVFDGTCVLCSGWVDFLLKHDRKGTIKLAAMQTETGATLLRAHGLDPGDPVSLLYVEDGVGHTDSEAIVRVLDALGGWFELANLAFGVPRFVRDPIYRYVARHRYRWFGRRDTCRVPDAATRDRFLE